MAYISERAVILSQVVSACITFTRKLENLEKNHYELNEPTRIPIERNWRTIIDRSITRSKG